MSDNYSQVFGDVLADHHGSPRNQGSLQEPTIKENGFNPVCGDQVTVYVKVSDNDIIQYCSFEGEGCLICMASASIMTSSIQGQTKEEAAKSVKLFLKTMKDDELRSNSEVSKDIDALYNTKRFPARIKCALLPWVALDKGLSRK